jgi:hypothetical protein
MNLRSGEEGKRGVLKTNLAETKSFATGAARRPRFPFFNLGNRGFSILFSELTLTSTAAIRSRMSVACTNPVLCGLMT